MAGTSQDKPGHDEALVVAKVMSTFPPPLKGACGKALRVGLNAWARCHSLSRFPNVKTIPVESHKEYRGHRCCI
jgi:hypothetical protein